MKLLSTAKTRAICPYCRDKLSIRSEIDSCSACRTLHHRSCWTENGHCSVFGCSGFQTEVDERIKSNQWRELIAGLVCVAVLALVPASMFLLERFSSGIQALLAALIFGIGVVAVLLAISRESSCPACGTSYEWKLDGSNEYGLCKKCGSRFLTEPSAALTNLLKHS